MSHPRARRSTYPSSSVAVAGGRVDQVGTGSRSGAERDAAFDRFEQTGAARTGGPRTGSGGGRAGSGRGRGGSGGRGGAPAARPPVRKRRAPLWARLLIAFGALLMLLSGGAIVGGKVLLYEATSGV